MHCTSVLAFIDLLQGEITSQPERLGQLLLESLYQTP